MQCGAVHVGHFQLPHSSHIFRLHINVTAAIHVHVLYMSWCTCTCTCELIVTVPGLSCYTHARGRKVERPIHVYTSLCQPRCVSSWSTCTCVHVCVITAESENYDITWMFIHCLSLPKFDRLFAEGYFYQLDTAVALSRSAVDNAVHILPLTPHWFINISLVLWHTTITTAQQQQQEESGLLSALSQGSEWGMMYVHVHICVHMYMSEM